MVLHGMRNLVSALAELMELAKDGREEAWR
jgi:hypothetical protein